ncbi:CsiV family protein [Neptunicella marina]|uniref:Peptidoglycan-binding protein, CsiV n=1 Tax=Neptunicella marina TaxID=2125989 RepID=A0A8J6M316_9ALTE|nr:CsiV family protein [Neptunicella marina]MBC3767018.1 hypothetical protein [Neptunicella marina]
MKNALVPALALISTLISPVSQAKGNDWWFDIEVIVFSRNSDSVKEQFDPVVTPIDISSAKDILTPYLAPDLSYLRQMLSGCESQKQGQQVSPLFYTEDFDSGMQASVQIPDWLIDINNHIGNLGCISDGLAFSPRDYDIPQLPDEVPAKIDGVSMRYPSDFDLLEYKDLELTSLYRQLTRQRGVHPLLHLGWRQDVPFGRNKATAIRLFAGKNYSSEFDYWGNTVEKPQEPSGLNTELGDYQAANQQNIVDRIEQAISDDDTPAVIKKKEQFVQQSFDGQIPTEVWQLDGLFKVFLQYTPQKVPYLHIDSQLNYRQPGALLNNNQAVLTEAGAPKQFLYSYPFNQLRRVISKELHYFDHPYFGMIVQIRRYYMPDPPPESEE